MVDKNIQIKNLTGDNLFPKTKGAVVINNAGENLGAVEAGAQVNKIEAIKIDGVELKITDKVAEYTTKAAAEYTIEKLAEADAGMASSYVLKKDGVAVGDKINIAKDQVLENVELKKCEEADKPIAGLVVGDPYMDFKFQNKDAHIYLAVKDLVDVYTAGAGLTLTNGKFAVNTEDAAIADTVVTEDSKKLVQSGAVFTAVKKVADDLAAHEADAVKHITAAERTKWDGKQDAIADLETIRANATAGKGAADTIETYGDIVTHNAAEFQTAIDATHKLDADLVDDATATHKFVTAEQLAKIDAAAADNAVVHLAGAETITGAKTFTGDVIAETQAAKDNSKKVATTAFVQQEIAGCLTYEELAE